MKKMTLRSLLFGLTVTGLVAEDSPTVTLPSTTPAVTPTSPTRPAAAAPAAPAEQTPAPAAKKKGKKHHKKKKPAEATTPAPAQPKS
jgi:hypothetical protein